MKLKQYLKEGTTKTIEREIEKAHRNYINFVSKVAEREYKKILVPFLKSRDWKFISGMGTYWIGPKKGKSVYPEDVPHDEEFQEIIKLLELEVEGVNDTFAAFMPDYKG